MITSDDMRRMHEGARRLRDVLARYADRQGIAVEEAEERVESMRRRLFPDGPSAGRKLDEPSQNASP